MTTVIAIAVVTTGVLVMVLAGLCRWLEGAVPAGWRLLTAALIGGLPNTIVALLAIDLFRHPAARGGMTLWPIGLIVSVVVYRLLIVKSGGNAFKLWLLQLPLLALIMWIALPWLDPLLNTR
jgi:hypothetical protein